MGWGSSRLRKCSVFSVQYSVPDITFGVARGFPRLNTEYRTLNTFPTQFSLCFRERIRHRAHMSQSSAPAAFRRLFDQVGTVDQVGVEERVAKFTTRSIKKASKLWGLKMAASMVEGASTGLMHPDNSATRPRRVPSAG